MTQSIVAPRSFIIESTDTGSTEWADCFPGQRLAKSEVAEHLDALRGGATEYSTGREFRVLDNSSRDCTKEF